MSRVTVVTLRTTGPGRIDGETRCLNVMFSEISEITNPLSDQVLQEPSSARVLPFSVHELHVAVAGAILVLHGGSPAQAGAGVPVAAAAPGVVLLLCGEPAPPVPEARRPAAVLRLHAVSVSCVVAGPRAAHAHAARRSEVLSGVLESAGVGVVFFLALGDVLAHEVLYSQLLLRDNGRLPVREIPLRPGQGALR